MEITSSILRTTKTSNWFKTIWSKRSTYLSSKRKLLFFLKGLLAKIKNDVIKLLLNLNIVVSSEEKPKKKKRK